MRKENIDSVCFVSKITEINEIPGADKIVQAKVGEYSCIVGKNQHQLGEFVMVCCTDAVIPEDLAINIGVKSYLRKGNRVKTVKLKGVYSECLILSLKNILLEMPQYFIDFYEGMDLQDILKIYKYEEPEIEVIPKVNKVYFKWNKVYSFKMWKGFFNYKFYQFKSNLTKIKNNPDFAVYFKFPNIKNAPDIFKDNDVIHIQRKIHGSNFRCMMNSKGEYYVGSHRVVKNAIIKHNFIKEFFIRLFLNKKGYYNTDIWQEMSIKYDIQNKLKNWIKQNSHNFKSIELYGEVFGAGVQGEYNYGLNHKECVFFDIQIDGYYLSPSSVYIVLYELGLPIIELLGVKRYLSFKNNKDRYLDQKIPNSKYYHEGVVIKSSIQGNSSLMAAKCISPNYLIQSDKDNLPDFH